MELLFVAERSSLASQLDLRRVLHGLSVLRALAASSSRCPAGDSGQISLFSSKVGL